MKSYRLPPPLKHKNALQKFLKELNESSNLADQELSKSLDFECYIPTEYHGIRLTLLSRKELAGTCEVNKTVRYISHEEKNEVSKQDNPLTRRMKHCKTQTPEKMQMMLNQGLQQENNPQAPEKTSGTTSKLNITLILAIAVSTLLIISVAVGIVCYKKKKNEATA